MSDSVSLKAGDIAPDIVFTEILHAGAEVTWTSASLSGRLTVLNFLPVMRNLVARDLQVSARWNSLVDEFADQPVQFVGITAEVQPSPGSLPREHPFKGWVFLDPLGATRQSYGMESPVSPASVIIGADGRILGFDRAILPSAQTLHAALEGRITTDALAGNGMVHLDAEPPPPLDPRPFRGHHPDLPPPSETVHISLAKTESGTTRSTGHDHWAALGFTLKGLLTELYEVQESLMDLLPDLDTAVRYDVALVLPGVQGRDQMVERIQRAVAREFRIDIVRQIRSTDIYVLTAPDGAVASAKFADTPGMGAIAGSWSFSPMDAAPTMEELKSGGMALMLSLFRRLPAIGSGFARLNRFLPFSFGLLTVSDAGPDGNHAIEIDCVGQRTDEQLFRALRDDLGILAARERRDVDMLVVRPRS